jgi:hypothetical protein
MTLAAAGGELYVIEADISQATIIPGILGLWQVAERPTQMSFGPRSRCLIVAEPGSRGLYCQL